MFVTMNTTSNILEAATGYTRLYVHVRRAIQCESKKTIPSTFVDISTVPANF